VSEFSDIGQLLILGRFLITEEAQIFRHFFPKQKLPLYYFDQKNCSRYIVGDFFSQTLVYTTVKICNKLPLSEKEKTQS
jgi:hypothetical protein